MTELRVTPMDDDAGGYVVRGTLDVDEARAALRAYLMQDIDEEYDAYPQREADEAAERAATLPVVRVGLFRWNPCAPNYCDEHIGHLGEASKPGPGVWRGVYLSW